MATLVMTKIRNLAKEFLASLALKGFLSSVKAHVILQMLRLNESLAAYFALVRSGTGMNAHVSGQMRLLAEGLMTMHAEVRLFSSVAALMLVELSKASEFLVAELALFRFTRRVL